MMRRVLFALMAVVMLAGGVARAATTSAPADEYFGAFNYSVFEIRNRLTTIENLSDVEMLKPDEIVGLDNLELALVQWETRFPRDPWIPKVANRLEHCYIRAHAEATQTAMTVLGLLMSAYPGSPEAHDVLAALEAQHPAAAVTMAAAPNLDTVSVSGRVVDDAGSPIPGAIVFVSPDRESSDVSSTPFVVTGADGAFLVNNVPNHAAPADAKSGPGHPLYVFVQPPRGASIAPSHHVLDGTSTTVDAGTIPLHSMLTTASQSPMAGQSPAAKAEQPPAVQQPQHTLPSYAAPNPAPSPDHPPLRR